MIERLEALKSKKFSNATELRNALKNDSQLRNEVEALSKYFLGRSVSGCGNCFFDAYMELINRKKMEEKSKFQLPRGIVLYDPINKDANKILTAANCTDELALYHLKYNPNCRKYFSGLPENIDELIAAFDCSNEPEAVKERKQREPKTTD
ncbi:MAG: hypothetical protein FWF52_00275 [Candidatus Azobacteroides sp.]|nr:hypothetical protein [Candidatus Azobacteroides sp.]